MSHWQCFLIWTQGCCSYAGNVNTVSLFSQLGLNSLLACSLSTWCSLLLKALHLSPFIHHHTIHILPMPLAEARHNKIAAPLKLPLWNGRKPESLLDLLKKFPGDTSSPEPLRMSAQQKSNSVDLALYRFAQAQTGNRFDSTLSTHSSFVRKASVRRTVGEYTSAVIEGMVCVLFLSMYDSNCSSP